MAKNTTLADLNAFLEEKGEVKVNKIKSKEEYIKKEPTKITSIPKLGNQEYIPKILSGISVDELAVYVNELAQEKGISYAEMCMLILEKGSEITPILKGGGVVTTWVSAHKTAFNVLKNTINKRIKG